MIDIAFSSFFMKETEAYPVDTGIVEVPNDLVLQARKLIRRLDDIKYYSDRLSLSENDGERRYTPDISSVRHTSSVVFEKTILGRDQDKEKIIDKLLSSEAGNHVSVMPIVGMGGVGKTTLAQLVYNSPRVRQSFEKHAWVCVSENFDIKTMTRNIITSLTSVQCMKYMTEWSEWPGTDAGGFPCLNTLSISFCLKMISLPLGPFQSLITLNLRWCDRLPRLPESPSLRKIEIGYCPALTEIATLPSLLVLIVKVCSGLRELPTLPSLLELDIFDCPSLISIGSAFSSPIVSPVCCFPKLTTLNLEQCPNLCAVGSVPALTTLNLKSGLSDKLMYSPLNDFPSLQCLNIDDSEFTCLPIKQQSLPSITRLCINKCPNLQNCDGLASLTSLEHLEVGECPKLPIDDLLPPQLKIPIVEDNEHGM